jgi:hypothetical protein
MEQIKVDVAQKKAYRMQVFNEFVELLGQYVNTFQFHMQVGEYLGIDEFRYKRIHKTLSGDLVRSKSEVIIANILFDRNIPFFYEKMLYAPDGSCYLPDFTIHCNGTEYYWEHLGMLESEDYARNWNKKVRWYQNYFPDRLITTKESATLSQETEQVIAQYFT